MGGQCACFDSHGLDKEVNWTEPCRAVPGRRLPREILKWSVVQGGAEFPVESWQFIPDHFPRDVRAVCFPLRHILVCSRLGGVPCEKGRGGGGALWAEHQCSAASTSLSAPPRILELTTVSLHPSSPREATLQMNNSTRVTWASGRDRARAVVLKVGNTAGRPMRRHLRGRRSHMGGGKVALFAYLQAESRL